MTQRRIRLAGVPAVSAVVLLAGAAAASAAPANPDPGARSAAAHPAAASQHAQQNVREYWTPQRMRNAESASTLIDKSGQQAGSAPVERGKPTTVPPAHGKAGKVTEVLNEIGAAWEKGGKVTKTTGKVFFTLGGKDYVCSGSAVNSQNKDVVLTAGHCVNEGPGAFATKWMFAPGYDQGKTPHGEWTARKLYTTSQWKNSGDISYDVGFAAMNTLNGKHLVGAVGGQGIGFNQDRGQMMYSFGYPAGSPYDGQDLIYCAGTVQDDPTGRTNDQGMKCNMTGGSSGGPWFVNFDPTTGTGTLNSVNSFKYRGDPKMYGPYFGSAVQQVYQTAQTA